MNSWKINDEVRLPGGPIMTIAGEGDKPGDVRCVWVHDGSVEDKQLPAALLRKARKAALYRGR